jgi:hypothetical protein
MDKNEKKIKELVNRSFPLLKKHKIIVKRIRGIYGARIYYMYFFSLYLIGKGGEKGLTKGGIAHELSHVEMFKNWGFWKSLSFSILQFFSTEIRKKIEAGADLYAIKKGYAKELYKARKKTLAEADDRIKILIKKYYLSLNEIKQGTKK